MKKFGIAVVLLCLFAVPALAAPGEMTFGLNGGAAIATGDFGKGFSTGFTGGVFGDYMFTDMVGAGVDLSYNRWKAKDVDVNFTELQFGGHIKLVPAMKDMPVAPYLQVGAGAYNGKTDVSGAESKTKFGYNIGIGADYKVTPQVGVGLFGTWHAITDAFESTTVDLSTGATTTEKKSANYIAIGLKVTFMTTPTTTTTKTTTP